jgi:signal transduction protein with GAF and PtsI domain
MKAFRAFAQILFLLGLSQALLAQEADKESSTSRKKENVETIQIVGRKTISRLRIELAENAFEVADLFNQFIKDEDLRFTCKKKKLPGSIRRTKVCESNFEKRIREELRAESIGANGSGDFNALSQASLFAKAGTKELDEKRQEQQALMTELSQTNPKFLEAIVRFNKSKEALHKNHERVYGKASRIRKNAERERDDKLNNKAS